MNPHDNPDAYFFALGGVQWVGEVILSGHDRDIGWDKKAAKGQTGGTSTLTGSPVGEFEATFLIVNDPYSEIDEFAAWDAFQKIIESTVEPHAKALPVYHPDLARNHFTHVCGAKIGGMAYDGKGGGSVKVKFIEYKPPKKKPAKKATAGVDAKKGAAPDPNIARKFQLEQLRAETATLTPVNQRR